ncbi:DUF2399 domain-containing protein [Amycolatopsis mongoliensis]|uniref:DUF2399 domain-containing protein n=1 Tax=Amycolatopsis mongoliensis TaxID=715475 RepID=UPI0038CC03BC
MSGRLRFEAGFSTVGCTTQARPDFNPAGFTIADQVLSWHLARSWRFDARTYAGECS